MTSHHRSAYLHVSTFLCSILLLAQSYAIEFGLPSLSEELTPSTRKTLPKQEKGEKHFSMTPNYSVIEQTGKFCPGRDSCKHKMRDGRGVDTSDVSPGGPFKHARGGGLKSRGHFGIENDWKKRNCFCDNLCEMYGDCCVDAPIYQMSHQSQNHLNFDCVSLKQYGDIYMRHQCRTEWDVTNKHDALIKDFCENLDAKSDPFGTTPVTNNVSGVTYRNYYCAICNFDASLGTLQFWRPRLECPTLNSHVHRYKNISKEFVSSHLRFSKARNVWGIDISMGGVDVFHDCYIDPVLPDEISHRVRLCSGRNTITTCPLDYVGNDTIRELCESYTALVFEPTKSFRNVHCAICNNASLESLYCLNLGPLGRSKFKQNFNLFSFAILFDISGKLDKPVGPEEAQEQLFQSKCDKDKLYDPFFKKCRTVYCHQNDAIFKNGSCIKLDDIAKEITTTEIILSSSVPDEVSTISTTIPTKREKVDQSSEKPKSISPIEFSTSSPKSVITTKSEISIDTKEEIVTKRSFNVLKEENTQSQISKTQFLDCPKFELQVGEFQILKNDDNDLNAVVEEHNKDNEEVYIKRYDKKLGKGQYSIKENNKLVICAPYVLQNKSSSDHKNLGIGKFGEYMGIVTFICLGISILCLILHIIVTLLLPELKNLSGKNLLSLCIALLGGYCSFVVSMFLEGGGVITNSGNEDSGCFILAVFMYFFFLSSFFWMLVMAFDVYRTLKLATKQLQPIDSSSAMGGQWKKFALYTIFGWVAPLTLVTVTVVIEHLKESIPDEYRPMFGEKGICWFGNKRALLVYFAVPFGGVMGANIFLFVCSARMIYLTRKNSTMKMITTTGCFNPKTNFILYVRLATIMGLTWVTGLVAGFVDNSWLWYTFVVFNTLQGLLIFCMFTCNRNVFESLKQKLCSSRYHVDQKSHYNFDAKDPNSWRWRNNDRSEESDTSDKVQDGTDLDSSKGTYSPTTNPHSLIPSRYGSRSKTMYTLSKTQASDTALNINSFNGRYY